MIELYKNFNVYDKDVALQLPLADSSRGVRGHSKKLFKARAIKNVGSNAFSHRVVNAWNSLPDNVITSNTVNSFERNLDNYRSQERITYDYRASPPGSHRKMESNIEVTA